MKVMGISYSQTQSGAYALILIEENGDRRIPIIIGGFEAQAIVIKLENLEPPRPLTHDLFKKFADEFGISVVEVMINKLEEGVFYSQLICNNGGKDISIDARTSDAIALALRFNAPIFTYKNILDKAGIYLKANPLETDKASQEIDDVLSNPETFGMEESNQSGETYAKHSMSELTELLDAAVEHEDYEKAAKIRDEISKREP